MTRGFTQFIERLEDRQLLSGVATPLDPRVETLALQPSDVSAVLANAASQARPGQAVAVVDREGTLLGLYLGSGVSAADTLAVEFLAIQRASTAAAFESTQDAFSTRTARFIIQNNFPQGVANTGGGPLYGVEFSSFPGADILPADYGAGSVGYNVGLSGDPGGLPLYIDGIPVGAIGVAGDLHDQAPNADLRNVLENQLPANLEALGGTFAQLGESLNHYETQAIGNRVFNGTEKASFDESTALAGSAGYAAPAAIRATQIFVGGLRLPYTDSPRARGKPVQTLDQLASSGAGQLVAVPLVGKDSPDLIAGTPEQVNGVVDGVPGLYRIRNSASAAAAGVDIQGIPAGQTTSTINSADDIITNAAGPGLTAGNIDQIIFQAVQQATHTRAGIRKPNGATARIHVVVTDTQGNVLGVFRMADATNFSYDVAVQKARTAAFFSDDSHAFSSTAIGFLSQGFFPPGINGGSPGPLYQLQDDLTDNPANLLAQGPTGPSPSDQGPLPDGITIFPGGVPLYIGGQLVGAVGVSGDGVNQDDMIAFAAEAGFRPPNGIRSDQLAPSNAANFLAGKLTQLAALPGVSLGSFNMSTATHRLFNDLNKVHLPYVKFPRNPTTL